MCWSYRQHDLGQWFWLHWQNSCCITCKSRVLSIAIIKRLQSAVQAIADYSPNNLQSSQPHLSSLAFLLVGFLCSGASESIKQITWCANHLQWNTKSCQDWNLETGGTRFFVSHYQGWSRMAKQTEIKSSFKMPSTSPPEHYHHQLEEILVSHQQHFSLASLNLWAEFWGLVFILYIQSCQVFNSVYFTLPIGWLMLMPSSSSAKFSILQYSWKAKRHQYKEFSSS